MKKIVYKQYGSHEVLQIAEVKTPTVNATELLVKVKAVSINPLDWKIFHGDMKIMSGSTLPKGVGIDFSGVVEQVGSEITSFEKDDEVFGLMDVFKGEALAEYILVNKSQIAIKPKALSFEQAAALPVAGASALQIVDQLAPVKRGTEVLINGASGGIGMIAIQLYKRKEANVTAVTNAKGVELAKRWGADQVLDYKQQNVIAIEKKFDTIIDLSGKLPFSKAKALLERKGVYISTLPEPKEIIRSFLNNIFSYKKYKILFLKPTVEQLKILTELAQEGLDVFIDKAYPITSFQKGYQEVANTSILGKAVFKIS